VTGRPTPTPDPGPRTPDPDPDPDLAPAHGVGLRRTSLASRRVSYSAMSRDEWLAFLRSPVRPALLATTRADGRPHVVPVWYDVDDDDETLVLTTGIDTVKGRNIRREGRAALCVQDDQPPFDFVSIDGTATWSDDLDEVRRWAARLGGRYMGADRAEEFGARNGVPGEVLVRVSLDHVVAYRDITE
jgi:PPOX class probable F420-dependent enzyme